jgi:putative FmdB family regulatory protein
VPTYSYRCTECDTAFDIQQAFTDDSLTECPTCGGKLRKVFSSIGVTFTGSGFYSTDTRSEAKTAAKSKSSAKPAKESGDKPAAKSGEKSSAPSKNESSSSASVTKAGTKPTGTGAAKPSAS